VVKACLDWVAILTAAMAVVLALSMFGCARPVVVQEVRVPIPVPCPEPPAVVRPTLPIFKIPKDAPPSEVVRAYAVSFQLLIGYAESLETILDGYRVGVAKEIKKP